MNDKINIYDLSENRINQAIENLTKFYKDKMQTFSDSLDVNLGIALQLIENQKELLKMKTKEIEKKDKQIDLMAEEIAFNYDINSYADVITIKKQLKEKYEKKAEEEK